MPTSLEKWDVIIIGGASAGLSAALYASRQGLNTLLVTKDIGGQALLTNDIENYAAFDHIGGYELMSKFEPQARDFGTKFAHEQLLLFQRTDKKRTTKRQRQKEVNSILKYIGLVVISR